MLRPVSRDAQARNSSTLRPSISKGGLISATLLTLILLPILYQRFGVEQPKGA